MKMALLAWLWQFPLWRCLCVFFVSQCPVESWSSWVFYHTGVGEGLRRFFLREGDLEHAARTRAHLAELARRYEVAA